MKISRGEKNGKKYWYVDVMMNGKRIRVSSQSSRQECIDKYNKKLEELKQQQEKRVSVQKRTRTLRASMCDWFDRYRGTSNGFTRPTTAGNAGILKIIIEGPLGSMRVCEITRDDIQDWILSMEGLSYNTKRNRFYLLRQYFESEYKNDPDSNPMRDLKLPRDRSQKKKKMLVLDDEQMDILVKELSKPRNQHSKIDPGYFNGGAVIVCMYEFLRASELCGLRKKDVDLEGKMLHISWQLPYGKDDRESSGGRIGSDPKYDEVRDIPIFPPAEPFIREAYEKCEKPGDYLFRGMYGNPLTHHPLRETLMKALQRCGLPHIRLHDLRHTGISFLLRHEVPVEAVSAWAGHASVQITTDIYYTVVQSQIDTGIQKAFQIWENAL